VILPVHALRRFWPVRAVSSVDPDKKTHGNMEVDAPRF
jgi:hypothetical protein